MIKKRMAVVGLGARSAMYTDAIINTYSDIAELAAFCDINQVRMDFFNNHFADEYGVSAVPTYKPSGFEEMIRKHSVDVVIVTSVDRTHHDYIIRAMEAGCDVITEKPMTTDESRAREILDAIDRTGRSLRVTFNYRYSPRNSRIKELLMDGIIGEIQSVHFEWLLDTRHGADYFRRWHRDKRNSGGLMVHKSTHHFDLMNWWLDSTPEQVFAMGGLKFYGRENAEKRGEERIYQRGTGDPNAAGDPFALDLSSDRRLKALYLDAEKEDGYRRDQSVFGDGISIEDDMGVIVRYESGAVMTYHLTAYSPWEGFRAAFNGTKGRLEYEVVEKAYVSGTDKDSNRPDLRDAGPGNVPEPVKITFWPHWEEPVSIAVTETTEGGHGGGDVRMLRDIFVGAEDDPLKRAADHMAGTRSIMVGIAANRSQATGMPVDIRDLRLL